MNVTNLIKELNKIPEKEQDSTWIIRDVGNRYFEIQEVQYIPYLNAIVI